jgi:RNA polymerase subunit RPABC4/transcription elongation factor Spt4
VPQQIDAIIQIAMALVGAYVAALWFCLIVWTFRDIQKRSGDVFVQILATLLVLLFNVPGLILYLILRPPESLNDAHARGLAEAALTQEIAAQAACPRCRASIDADFRICPVCQTALRQPCPGCARLVRLDWVACPYCTRPVDRPEAGVASTTAIYTATAAPAREKS